MGNTLYNLSALIWCFTDDIAYNLGFKDNLCVKCESSKEGVPLITLI